MQQQVATPVDALMPSVQVICFRGEMPEIFPATVLVARIFRSLGRADSRGSILRRQILAPLNIASATACMKVSDGSTRFYFP